MTEVKVGDILKFEKPIHEWHAEDLAKGAYYVVEQNHKKNFYQTADGWWHVEELAELDDPHLVLRCKKGCFDHGKFKEYADRKFEVLGNIGG